ncbi:MAG TPA: hypothetical protein HPQ00_02700 [Magnetococcales bacterium]|nr:hypothetical protein [Magnetococcales bacterium]
MMFLGGGCVSKRMDQSNNKALGAVRQEIAQFATDPPGQDLEKRILAADKTEADGDVSGEHPLNHIPMANGTPLERPLNFNPLPLQPCQVPGKDCPGSQLAVEPRFNLRVESAPVREFFTGLVKDTPYNASHYTHLKPHGSHAPIEALRRCPSHAANPPKWS